MSSRPLEVLPSIVDEADRTADKTNIAIRIRNLGKCYQIYDKPQHRLLQMLVRNHKKYFRDFWALKNLSLDVKRGETVGIVGRNGSGKSTLLQLICGTLSPTCGFLDVTGRIAALLELGSGFNPEFTGRENIYMYGAVLGLTRDEIDARYDDIVGFADVSEFIDQPIKTYSTGMVVRVAFSVAINVNPQILVVDEALSVGDAAFQRKCMRQMEELTNSGVTLLFVSHDTDVVKKICSYAIYLAHGEVKHQGKAKDVCLEYERDLFGASRVSDRTLEQMNVIAGNDTVILDPELLISSEKVYGDERLSIADIYLTTADGRRANVMQVGAKFRVSYEVTFHSRVPRPIFGMMVTTKEGVCVFGVNTRGKQISTRVFECGGKVRIGFDLTNNLGPGVYYLTCGVHSFDGPDGLIFNQRRMDALIFKSVGRDGETASGMAHLFPDIRAEALGGALGSSDKASRSE